MKWMLIVIVFGATPVRPIVEGGSRGFGAFALEHKGMVPASRSRGCAYRGGAAGAGEARKSDFISFPATTIAC